MIRARTPDVVAVQEIISTGEAEAAAARRLIVAKTPGVNDERRDMAETAMDAPPRRCWKCGESEVDAPHVLCTGCKTRIATAEAPWGRALERARELSSQYR